MAPITVYHFPISAPSRSAVLAARNCNVDIEIKEINLIAKEQLKPEFLKINPQHIVPTIDDNGFVLWESRAIAEYFVAKYAPNSGLVPSDPKEHAVMAQRLYFDAGTLYPRIRAICFPVLFLGETSIPEDKRKDLKEAFDWLNQFLDEKKWFAGDRVTIADLAILASLASIVHVGADISSYKNLSAWYENCKALPGWEENNTGAKAFGDRVKGNLKEQL